MESGLDRNQLAKVYEYCIISQNAMLCNDFQNCVMSY